MTNSVTSSVWLKRAQAGLWAYASSDLESLFKSLDLSNPKQARDVLLREAPPLTTFYGEQAAVIAADWYDELRYLEGVPGQYRARMADPFPAEFVEKRLRFGAAHLFTETPQLMLPFLLDALQEYVLQPGRDTIQRSAIEDPQASGWHREVSPGACGFCRMLAGRGGVYKKATASFAAHGNCNCSARPSWDHDAEEVPVSAYVASERMQKIRNRAAAGDEAAIRVLDDHRKRVRDYIAATK